VATSWPVERTHEPGPKSTHVQRARNIIANGLTRAKYDRAHNKGVEMAERAGKRSNRETGRIVLAIVILVILIIFVVDNLEQVRVSFVFFKADVGLIWVLIATALIGALIDRMFVWRGRRR